MRFSPVLTNRTARAAGALVLMSTLFLAQHARQPVSAQAVLTVRTVPWLGLPNKPHEVFSTGSIVLQGVATQGLTDTPATGIVSATWDAGDGNGPVAVSFTNPLAIERTVSYTAAAGTPFTATLTVTNNLGQTATDTFKVVVRAKTIDVEANMAIDKGLWYLHKAMNRSVNNSVSPGVPVGWLSGNDVPTTAGSAQAFAINNHRTTGNVAEDPYVHDISRMLRYLESQLTPITLSVQTAGYPNRSDNPDTDGNNIGLVYNSNQNYINGQIMDALVASGTPTQTAALGPLGAPVQNGVRTRQYQDIVRDMNDYNAWSQMDVNNGQRGSWYYFPSNNGSAGHGDNSIAQWPAIGGLAAERTWGVSIAPFVKSEVLQYLPTTANTAANGNYSGISRAGSFGYANVNQGWSENFATTPSALVQYIWAGVRNDPTPDNADEQRVRDGYTWMARWHRLKNNYSCCDTTFGGTNFYALYATAKAYRLNVDEDGNFAPITLVDDDPADSVPAWDWYYNDPPAGSPAAAGPKGMARAVISNQAASGQFPGGGQWTGNMSTAWGIIILSPTLFQLGPSAVCTANPSQIGSFGGTVNFSAAGTTHNDPDGVISTYTFTFDHNGQSQTGASTTASYTYPSRTTFPHTYNATLTVTDSNGLTDTAQCPVEQVNTNVQPDADAGGPYTFCQGSALILDGRASSDPEDGAVASYKWDWTAPFNFTPADATTATVDVTAHFNALPPGIYDVGLQVTDSLPASNTEFTTITVKAATDPSCNQPPTATDNAYTTNEDTPLNGNVVSDGTPDSDPDADTLTATLVGGTSNGGLVFNNGAFTYTPNVNYCGPDSFTYKVNDGTVDSNLATVTINVTCVNDGPNAEDDSNSTVEDTPVSGSVTGNDSSTDVDGDTLTWTKTSDPANGSVSFTNGAYTYTPNANFCGSDSFTYAISDGTASDSATVTIDISCVNDAPTADDDSNSTTEDTAVSGSVTGNDTAVDADGDTLTWTQTSNPANGSVTFTNGSYTYTPNANFCGSDSFTYAISDGTASDPATVTIAISCVNDAPTADDDSNSTNEDAAVSGSVTGNDTAVDADGDTLTWTKTSDPANGSVSFTNGAYTYTPNANFCGTDSFTYAISDGTASDSATVTITVNCVNDPPVANDNAHTTPEDTAVSGAATSSDVDGGAPAYALTSGPSNGTLTFNANGSYTYTPNANYNGPDAFTFSVSDGNGGSDSGQVTIDVTPVNDVPYCAAAAPSVALLWPPNHQLVSVNVLGVTDPVEGSDVTITIDSIWQDEPTNAAGTGNTPIDGYGIGSTTAQVRAERIGNPKAPGDGRFYHINFTGTDAGGATCTGTVKVAVPHDQGNGGAPVDGGALYKSHP